MKEQNEKDIPWQQKLLDRPFLLLFAGLIVMFGFYTIWGIIELVTMPNGTLP